MVQKLAPPGKEQHRYIFRFLHLWTRLQNRYQKTENRNSVQISPLCPPLYNRHTRLQNKYMFNWQLTTAGALFGVIIWDRKDITRWEMRMLCWHLICSQSEEFEQMMREPLTIKLFWSPRAHFRCEICSSSFLSPFPAPVSSLDQARPVQSWGIEGRVVLSLFSPSLVHQQGALDTVPQKCTNWSSLWCTFLPVRSEYYFTFSFLT